MEEGNIKLINIALIILFRINANQCWPVAIDCDERERERGMEVKATRTNFLSLSSYHPFKLLSLFSLLSSSPSPSSSCFWFGFFVCYFFSFIQFYFDLDWKIFGIELKLSVSAFAIAAIGLAAGLINAWIDK